MANKTSVYDNLIDIKEKLKQGQIGIIPTDTVYGLVASVSDTKAVDRLCNLKRRDLRPGTIIAANIDQLVEIGFTQKELVAAEQFWPNAISAIIPAPQNMSYLHQGLDTLAVRIPDDRDLIKLLEFTGPLMTTSANLTGEKTAGNIEEAQEIFEDKIDFYVDGGDLSGRKPSTIISVESGKVKVLRAGAIEINASEKSYILDNGPFYHGTKADLRIGDLLTAGFSSNYRPEIIMNHIYFTALVNGAGLAAELSKGYGHARVYVVEPTGNFENDPNVTDKKFPGNPTRSYRSQKPLKIIGEVSDWERLTPEQLQEWRTRLANVKGDIVN